MPCRSRVLTVSKQFADVPTDAFNRRILNFELKRVLPTNLGVLRFPGLNVQASHHVQ